MARLRSLPVLDGVLVGSDLKGHRPGDRAVEVVLEPGGRRVVQNRLDRFTFTLNHYAASKEAASNQAFAAREYLLEVLPGLTFPPVAVDEVTELDAPFDLSDEDSQEQRFIHRISLYVYET
ncbi:hypothetical protein ABZ470_31705 [Streptosporangium sp. NPDC020072]|uniref:hypothetical protein n=1 Tax=Streptosporangium sp. NPDC020072 TaxID=3154788 RepID=UPI00343B901A